MASKDKKDYHYNQEDKDKRLTKMGINMVKQSFGDNAPKEYSKSVPEIVEEYAQKTGMDIYSEIHDFGFVLNEAQRRVLDAIVRVLSLTGYKGHRQFGISQFLDEICGYKQETCKALVKEEQSPYHDIEEIPALKLTQSELIQLAGYELTHGDKVDVKEALKFLRSQQFCFYWQRLKMNKGKPVKNKNGDYVKLEIMLVDTLFKVFEVREEEGENKRLLYYVIMPTAALLDQIHNYFLLVPYRWEDEIKKIAKKKAYRYDYVFLLWLRLKFEEIRCYHKKPGENNPFVLNKTFLDIALALKMPESIYKRKIKIALQIIEDAITIALRLGYLTKVEMNGEEYNLYLNEDFYPKPGQLN
jgi:hypothetical protein